MLETSQIKEEEFNFRNVKAVPKFRGEAPSCKPRVERKMFVRQRALREGRQKRGGGERGAEHLVFCSTLSSLQFALCFFSSFLKVKKKNRTE